MSGFQAYKEDLDHRRGLLLQAMLDDVPFDGWRIGALYRGAERLGLSRQDAELAFPGGLREIAEAWSSLSDKEMLLRLECMDLDAMRVRDRIATGVRTRIEVNALRREALRRLMGWLALPLNSPIGMANAARTVNHIWYAAGDTSSDWNYYTKRGLLLPVYTTTVLYWLADEADGDGDYPATWSYLDRRIEDVLRTFGFPRRVKARLDEFMMGAGVRRGT